MNAILFRPPTRNRPPVSSDLDRPFALYKNGHALILSSIATSVIGFVFWIIAARTYSASVVGRDTAALSAMTFIGGIAQFNLVGALVRFIPGAGSRTRRFVLGTYAISVATAIPLSLGFIALLPHIAPSLVFLRADWVMVLWWSVATATWTLFILEDGVLTGLGQSRWVPIENVGFSFAKIALVLPLAAIAPKSGIYLAWSLATVATIIPTNALLFRRLIPQAQKGCTANYFTTSRLVKYVPYDSLASLCWLVATSVTPLLVIHRLGPTQSAYYSLDWLTVYALYIVSINMGSSMIVESALDPSALRANIARVRVHLAKLLIPTAVVVVVGSSAILRLFGSAYAEGGATTLRILVLSALPFIVTSTALSALRVREKTRLVFLLNAAIGTVVLSLVWLLVPDYGVRGAAIAWLVAQCVAAIAVVAMGDARIVGASRQSIGERSVPFQLLVARIFVKLNISTLPHPIRKRRERDETTRVCASELAEFVSDLTEVDGLLEIVEMDMAPSASDLSVVLLHHPGQPAFVALKFPRTERASLDLQAQASNLVALASDERLGDWRALLPRLRLLESGHTIYAAEVAITGVDAGLLLAKTPSHNQLVARVGLDVIDGLHRPTAFSEVLGSHDLEDLIEVPLRTLSHTHPSGCVPSTQRYALEIIGDRLRGATRDKIIDLSWTHGDFSPGNIMMSAENFEPMAVLDWGQARPRGIPAIEVLSWLIMVTRVVNKRQFGIIICDLLSRRNIRDSEMSFISSEVFERSNLDYRDLSLWCWLHHIAGNLEKSQRYGHNPLWWAANVESVLMAVTR